MNSPIQLLTAVLTAAILLSSSPARASGPLSATVALASSVLFGASMTLDPSEAAATAATSVYTSSAADRKVLANSTLEDAAYFYASGELRGTLPAAVARMRELNPELSQASAAELVDALVQAAELVGAELEATTGCAPGFSEANLAQAYSRARLIRTSITEVRADQIVYLVRAEISLAAKPAQMSAANTTTIEAYLPAFAGKLDEAIELQKALQSKSIKKMCVASQTPGEVLEPSFEVRFGQALEMDVR